MGALKPKGIQNMKRFSSIVYIVSLAFAGLIFTGCASNQADRANTAQFRSFAHQPGRKLWGRSQPCRVC